MNNFEVCTLLSTKYFYIEKNHIDLVKDHCLPLTKRVEVKYQPKGGEYRYANKKNYCLILYDLDT